MKILPEGISRKEITFIILLMVFQIAVLTLLALTKFEGWLAALLLSLLVISGTITFIIWLAFGVFVLLPLFLFGTGIWLVANGTPIGIGVGVALIVCFVAIVIVAFIIWKYRYR